MQGTWESDGSEADGLSSWASTTDNDGESYTITGSTPRSSPMNVAYKLRSNTTSQYFYQVNVLEMPSSSSSLSIGVVLPQEFQRGYKNRGMFYNGNLTNCGAALKTSYGPRLKEGDILILGYSEDDHDTPGVVVVRLEVYLNGYNLGTAFQVPKNGSSSFCPCVSIQGDTIKVQAKILAVLPDPLPAQAKEEKDPLEGKWDLLEAYHDGQQFYPPPPDKQVDHDVKPCLVSLEKDKESAGENLWNVAVHVCNTIMTRKTIQASGTTKKNSYSLQSHGGCRSTMMMPTPPYGQVESTMSASLQNAWSQMEIVGSAGSSTRTLIIKSSTGDVVAKCCAKQEQRSSTEPACCTSYQ
jgi:hypothetical protein